MSRGQEKDVGGAGTVEDVDCRGEVDGVDNDSCRAESGVEDIVGGLLVQCRRWRVVVGVESERMDGSDKILSVVGSQAT